MLKAERQRISSCTIVQGADPKSEPEYKSKTCNMWCKYACRKKDYFLETVVGHPLIIKSR